MGSLIEFPGSGPTEIVCGECESAFWIVFEEDGRYYYKCAYCRALFDDQWECLDDE